MSDKQIDVTYSDHLVAERLEMRREGRIMEQREKGGEWRREKGKGRKGSRLLREGRDSG